MEAIDIMIVFLQDKYTYLSIGFVLIVWFIGHRSKNLTPSEERMMQNYRYKFRINLLVAGIIMFPVGFPAAALLSKVGADKLSTIFIFTMLSFLVGHFTYRPPKE